MADILPIVQLGDPVLRQMAQQIEAIEAEWMQRLIDVLLLTLRHSNGVGLAAPQVSQSHQLFIVASRPNARYPDAPEMEPIAMINPRVLAHSDEQVTDWEGCLSIPGLRAPVSRYRDVEVEYTTRTGTLQRQVLSGFVARIFQHELDHLQGRVFLDRLSTLQEVMTEQEYFKRVVR